MAEPEFTIWPAVLMGETADVYFQRTTAVLRNESINPVVTMEFFPHRAGLLCGVKECLTLLKQVLPKSYGEAGPSKRVTRWPPRRWPCGSQPPIPA